MGADFDAEQESRSIFKSMQVASLGTVDADGAPFVSLVTVAPFDGNAVMLLSGLAVHTKNLTRDPRCSLLLVGCSTDEDDPLAVARLTIQGEVTRLRRELDEPSRAAFLKHHPPAAMYADFGDFAIYQLQVLDAHLVAGFGRIVSIKPEVFRSV